MNTPTAYRTLVRVIAVDKRGAFIYLPAYMCYAWIYQTQVPVEVWGKLQPGYRCHVKVAVKENDGKWEATTFTDWECV